MKLLFSPKGMENSDATAFQDRRKGVRQKKSPDVGWPHIPSCNAVMLAFGVAAFLSYYDITNPDNKQPLTLLLASLIVLLGSTPMYFFLRGGRIHQVPLLEIHAMFYAICFGWGGFLPFVSWSAAVVPSEADVQKAQFYTVAGLLALFFGYYPIGAHAFRRVQPMRFAVNKPSSYFAWLGGITCIGGLVSTWLTNQVPVLIIFAQVGPMFYSFGFFLLFILTLEKKIGFGTSVATLLILLPYEVLLQSGLSNGQLAGVVTLSCWIGLIVLRTWRRVPVFLIVGAFLFAIVLQPVKFYVRSLTWGQNINLGPVATIHAYSEGFRQTYGSASGLLASRNEAFEASFTRLNLLLMTAAIISDTPSRQPFLHGKTYVPLLTKWIPRALWKEKPEEDLGNRWARAYGFLGENDTRTSFNLPWLPEMYMNFGLYGVCGIMFLVGVSYRFLWKRMMENPARPVDYTISLVFASSLAFVESHLSLEIGKVIIFSIALRILSRILGLRSLR